MRRQVYTSLQALALVAGITALIGGLIFLLWLLASSYDNDGTYGGYGYGYGEQGRIKETISTRECEISLEIYCPLSTDSYSSGYGSSSSSTYSSSPHSEYDSFRKRNSRTVRLTWTKTTLMRRIVISSS